MGTFQDAGRPVSNEQVGELSRDLSSFLITAVFGDAVTLDILGHRRLEEVSICMDCSDVYILLWEGDLDSCVAEFAVDRDMSS